MDGGREVDDEVLFLFDAARWPTALVFILISRPGDCYLEAHLAAQSLTCSCSPGPAGSGWLGGLTDPDADTSAASLGPSFAKLQVCVRPPLPFLSSLPPAGSRFTCSHRSSQQAPGSLSPHDARTQTRRRGWSIRPNFLLFNPFFNKIYI